MIFEGYLEGAKGLAIHPDGHIMAISDKKGTIKMIKLDENIEVGSFQSTNVPNSSFKLFRKISTF